MPKRKTGKNIICKICKREFYVTLARFNRGKVICCSTKCLGITWKGHIPWNKGIQTGIKPWLGKKRPPFSKEWREKMGKSRSGNKNYGWKGGRYLHNGYMIILKPTHPLCDRHGYVKEHRLVVEKYLGRYLTRKEVVHHEGAKTDNDIKKLIVFENNGYHRAFHRYKLPIGIIFDGRNINSLV